MGEERERHRQNVNRDPQHKGQETNSAKGGLPVEAGGAQKGVEIVI